MIKLTPHQLKIAELRLQGLKRRQIAAKLGVTEDTIRNTIQDIYLKLGIHNVAQLGMALREESSTKVSELTSDLD